MNAMPVSIGKCSSTCLKDSRPPAEAPIPTTGKICCGNGLAGRGSDFLRTPPFFPPSECFFFEAINPPAWHQIWKISGINLNPRDDFCQSQLCDSPLVTLMEPSVTASERLVGRSLACARGYSRRAGRLRLVHRSAKVTSQAMGLPVVCVLIMRQVILLQRRFEERCLPWRRAKGYREDARLLIC